MLKSFDNRFIRQLPGDPDSSPRTRQVHGAMFSRVVPTPVAAPRVLCVSEPVRRALGISEEDASSERFAQVFAGNELLEGMEPYAHCYGGHQFGSWAGQLGDGRAISLGEVVHGGARFELSLKGAGRTPYSRHADGRAVLRSSVREYLCSEAMAALGVPTTRALSLVATGEGVVRDMFYDGHPREEPGAIVCRVAPSFLRFGSYQLPSARGDRALLAALVRYTIDNLFPGLEGSEELKLAHWFERVCVSTARLVVDWMRVGFVHGVLNTDNMSILGLTIDYGPYGFLDDYDPAFTPNTTDSATRRYRYAAQPEIGLYNLTKLAEALSSLFPSTEVLVAGLSAYEGVLRSRMQEAFSDKLGLTGSEEDDADLIATLGRVLAACEVDMTLFFRRLGELELGELGRGGHDRGAPSLAHFEGAFYDPRKIEQHGRALSEWLARYAARSLRQPEAWLAGRRAHMRAHNPAFILRNYLVHEAIERAEQGDLGGVARLERALAAPYEEPEEFADLRVKRPDWAKSRPGCSMLSCSS